MQVALATRPLRLLPPNVGPATGAVKVRSRFKLSVGSICLEKLLSGLHDACGFIIRDFALS